MLQKITQRLPTDINKQKKFKKYKSQYKTPEKLDTKTVLGAGFQ